MSIKNFILRIILCVLNKKKYKKKKEKEIILEL